MKAFNSIVKNENEMIEAGYTIRNTMLMKILIKIHGHFGNVVYPVVNVTDPRGVEININITFDYMSGPKLAAFISNLIEFLNLSRDDGVFLTAIHDVPIRVVMDAEKRIIGFGHFMDDRFILFDDIKKASFDVGRVQYAKADR